MYLSKSDPNREEIFEIGRSEISNPKSEIANWTMQTAKSNLRFRNFGFEISAPQLSKFSQTVPGNRMSAPGSEGRWRS